MAFFNIREWLDRISEHPNRRTLTNVEDATDVKTYDLSRAEGEVSVQGTALTGANLTDLERRIGAAFTAVENAMPEANPAETATGSLTKLKVDGTVYEVEGGGGGTTIEKITKAEWDAMTAEEREDFIGVVEDTNADYVPLTAENIPFDSNDSIAEKVGKITVKLTLAEYNALTEKAPNTRYIITDAPALEYTSEDLSYDGGTTTTKQKIDEKANKTQNATLTPESGVQVMHISSGSTDKQGCISAEIRFTGSANAWKTLGTLSITPNDACQVIGINTGTGAPMGIVRLRNTGVLEVYPTSAITNSAVGFSIAFVMT